MSRQLTQQEPKVCYTISFRGEMTTFLWTAAPGKPLKSSVDLKVKMQPSEVMWLAENLGCLLGSGKVFASSLDIYNRLLIYACVRPTLKNLEKATSLAMLVLELNSWDALYWASRFRELWWKHEKYKRLLKAAKAFKLFFDME